MASDVKVCIKAVRGCLLGAAARGKDIGPLVAASGLDPAALGDPYARVDHAAVAALWREVPSLCEDDAFGIHTAENVHAIGFDAVDYSIFHCATIGDALRRLTRYARLLHDAATIELEIDGPIAHYRQRLDCEPKAPRHLIEFIFAMWMLRVRRAAPGAPIRSVAFEHAAPLDAAEHRRVFRTEVRFSAPANEIVFDASLLDAPGPTADATLLAVLDRTTEELLARLPPKDDLLAAIRKTICAELESGGPDLDRVARALRTSRRSLQRRMKGQGTTFQALVDEVRRDVVLGRLKDPAATLTEVAFEAGFSDTTTFHRAFRRWTGSTPAEYRRVL